MGWLTMPRAAMGGHTTPKAYLDAQFTYECAVTGKSDLAGYRVLASACPANRTWYGAVEQYDEAGRRVRVIAAICLVRWNPRARDGHVFGYKDMDETAGPSEAACPQQILDLLTSTDDPYALDWRRRCHQRLRLRARELPDNALIRFQEPMQFTDGSAHAEFRVRRDGRRIVLTPNGGAGRCRVSCLMDRRFAILAEPPVPSTYFPSGVA